MALLRFTPNGTLWVVLVWQLVSLQTVTRHHIVQDGCAKAKRKKKKLQNFYKYDASVTGIP